MARVVDIENEQVPEYDAWTPDKRAPPVPAKDIKFGTKRQLESLIVVGSPALQGSQGPARRPRHHRRQRRLRLAPGARGFPPKSARGASVQPAPASVQKWYSPAPQPRKPILVESHLARNMLLPSKASVDKPDLAAPGRAPPAKARGRSAGHVQAFADIQKLFGKKRKTLQVTDEESKPVNISPHVIKYG